MEHMENQIAAERAAAVREAVRSFCGTWFERRDAEGTLAFLSEEVRFVGTGENEFAQGKEEMAAYLRQDIREIPEPFACVLSVIHQMELAEGLYSLSAELYLKNTLYTWHLRGFFILAETEGQWRIKSLDRKSVV